MYGRLVRSGILKRFDGWGLFWAEGVRDLGIGLITSGLLAVVVGVILTRWQAGLDSKREKQLTLALWSMVIPKLRLVTREKFPDTPKEDPLSPMNGEYPFAGLASVAEPLPVAVWAEAAPDSRSLVALRTFLFHYPAFRDGAEDVGRTVEGALAMRDTGLILDKDRLREHRRAVFRHLSSRNDGWQELSVALAGVFDRFMKTKLSDEAEATIALAGEVAREPRVIARWEEYVGSYAQISDLYNEVSESLSKTD